MDRNERPYSHTIEGAVQLTGLSKTKIYRALRERKITAIKAGKRTLILHEPLVNYLASLPVYKPGA